MKKEFLFFAVLSFILLINSIESYEMRVGISPFINASLSVATNETTYYRGETVDIINTLENKGNNESIGNLTTRLFAPNSSEILREDWFDIPLQLTNLPEYYSTSYDFPLDADFGIYIVTSNFTYENKTANASTEFELKARLTTTTTAEGEGNGGGGGEERETTTTLMTIVTTTSTVETTTPVTVTTTEITTTTTPIVTMPAFVSMPYLIWIILATLVMIIISVWIKMRKKPRKRRSRRSKHKK